MTEPTLEVLESYLNEKIESLVEVLGKLLELPEHGFGFDLKLVHVEAMKRLNYEYRGKDVPTDVLSFSSPEVFSLQGNYGEIVICYEVASQHARERGLSLEMEAVILVVHGALHLLGYDHEKSEKDLKDMADIESLVLKQWCPASWVSESGGRCLTGLIERVKSDSEET